MEGRIASLSRLRGQSLLPEVFLKFTLGLGTAVLLPSSCSFPSLCLTEGM